MTRTDFIKIGNKVIEEYGPDACESGYGTVEPEWVGRQAVAFGDVDEDGTLN